MRPTPRLNSAHSVEKWKIYSKIFFYLIFGYILLSNTAEQSQTGLACLSNPCIYGICIDDINGTFSCYCIDGYTGFLCQTNWDECWSNPCQNGGTCNDGIAHFNCTCPPGYRGDHCEQNIDECDSNPCLNNGTCVDGSNGYTCICPSGYIGSFCENDISVCNDTHETRCLNGGFCLEGPGFTFNCICQIGWEGQYCENDIDECASFPCVNGGVCLDSQANYTCACPFGFSGRNCEIELKMCGDTSPCQNGAVCLVEDRLRVCYCVPDFHGDRCQFQYNECLLGPGCLNGGTCIDGVDGYDCSCPPGWTGNFCECLVLSENDIDCSYPFSFPVSPITLSQVPTVPSWKETKVPKPTTSTKLTTPNYFYSFLTECIPIWPHFTIRSPHPQRPTYPSNWFTKKVGPTQQVTASKSTKLSILTEPITELTKMTTTTPSTTTGTTSTAPPTTTTSTTTTTETTLTTTTTESTTTTTTTTEPTTTTTTTTEPTTTTTITTEPTTSTSTTTETATPTTTTTESTTTTVTEPTTTTELTPTTTTTEITTTSTTERTTLSTTTTSTTSRTTVPTTTEEIITEPETPTFTIKEEVTDFTLPPLETTDETTECPDLTSSTLSPWNCKKVPCLNGGTCQSTTNGLRCICKSNWEGPYCETKVDIKIAGLSGKSFLSHKLTNTHNIRIDVTARTIASEGLILYSHLGHKIFMTLYMENGLLKFKFSCGVQTMVLSEVQFRINNGYDLVASVTLDFVPPTSHPQHCAAAVRINNTLAMSGEQLAKGPRVDGESAMVYIGGIPSQYIDKKESPVLTGFVGCMQNLMIDRKSRGIFKDSFDSSEVIECKSLACISNPCRSGSTCVEQNSSWTCMCPSGFLGKTCEKSVCSNNPCLFGGTCAPFPGSGFICLCPLGKQGLFCENDIQTGYPLFSSSIAGYSSFAAYKLPTEIYQDMLLTFKFLPHDMEQISLMVFIGQDGYHKAMSDHLAVSFIKGYVVLTWNLGSGPRRIFTQKPVQSTGRFFHTVQIGRSGQRGWLAVDNQRNVTGRSPGKLTQLNTRSIVYLGGHDSRNFSFLPHDLPLHTGFSGCLFDVELRTGQMLIKLEKSTPAFSRGVGQCGKSLCNEHSCGNGGGCINHGATFTCLCAEGWFGPTCAMKYNPCDVTRHNCSEGSTCVPLTKGYFCDCPVGKTGQYCEKNEELSDVKLKGIRSYLALPIEGLHQFQSCIDLEIRPLNNNGLILYSGKPERNSFWSLWLQDGLLELRVSPGVQRKRGDLLIIRSRRILSLDRWYRIRAGRYGRKLFLWVEGTVNTGVLLPGENLPPLGTIVYIGGVPDMSQIPNGVSGRVAQPFKGCVRKFSSQWKDLPLIRSNILEGRNVEDCDGSVCGGDVCQNGGSCYINTNNEPECSCLKQYMGKRCEYRLSCKEMQCQNGGRCAQEKALIPQCHCPNGWGGPFCESGVTVNAPHFGGNSYLMVQHLDTINYKRHTKSKADVKFIYLNFTTAEKNGMLLWSSNDENAEFVGVGIENGKMKIVWSKDDQNVMVVHLKETVADGGWHDLSIRFDSPNVTILMDKKILYKSNETYFGFPLVTNGIFFLGGFPDSRQVINETLGHFLSGFDGCLQKMSWNGEMEIFNFSKFKGENIRACNPFQ